MRFSDAEEPRSQRRSAVSAADDLLFTRFRAAALSFLHAALQPRRDLFHFRRCAINQFLRLSSLSSPFRCRRLAAERFADITPLRFGLMMPPPPHDFAFRSFSPPFLTP
jgi:hypothetical protein